MRVMVLVKATEESEAGAMPSSELLEEMGAYNQKLIEAGIMQAGEGLHPTSKGKRILFDGPERTVLEGPFGIVNELVAGFWIWKVRDMDEAIEWAKQCPNPMPGPSELEIRPIFEAEDFAEAMTPEAAELHEGNRERLGGD